MCPAVTCSTTYGPGTRPNQSVGELLDASLDRLADAASRGIAWWLASKPVRLGRGRGLGTGGTQATSYVKARAEAVGCRAEWA